MDGFPFCAAAQPQESSRDFLQVEAEIFGGQIRDHLGNQPFIPQDFSGRISHQLCRDGPVVQDGIPIIVIEFAVHTGRFFQAIQDVLDEFRDPFPVFFVQGPDGPFQGHFIGHYIVPGPAPDGADIDGSRSQGTDPAADDMADLLEEIRCCHDGIDAFLGMACMGRLPFDHHFDPVGTGHHGTCLDADFPTDEAGPHMEPENGLHVLEEPVFHHVPGPTGRGQFFRRLEQDPHTALDFFFPAEQPQDGFQQSGDMDIMAAGMHDARILRSVGKSGGFFHGKGINIGPEGHHRPRFPAFEGGSHTIMVCASYRIQS